MCSKCLLSGLLSHTKSSWDNYTSIKNCACSCKVILINRKLTSWRDISWSCWSFWIVFSSSLIWNLIKFTLITTNSLLNFKPIEFWLTQFGHHTFWESPSICEFRSRISCCSCLTLLFNLMTSSSLMFSYKSKQIQTQYKFTITKHKIEIFWDSRKKIGILGNYLLHTSCVFLLSGV